ncbi:MAG: hypothetical protein AAGJ35_13620, partial [Myxococcota bacterium]
SDFNLLLKEAKQFGIEQLLSVPVSLTVGGGTTPIPKKRLIAKDQQDNFYYWKSEEEHLSHFELVPRDGGNVRIALHRGEILLTHAELTDVFMTNQRQPDVNNSEQHARTEALNLLEQLNITDVIPRPQPGLDNQTAEYTFEKHENEHSSSPPIRDAQPVSTGTGKSGRDSIPNETLLLDRSQFQARAKTVKVSRSFANEPLTTTKSPVGVATTNHPSYTPTPTISPALQHNHSPTASPFPSNSTGRRFTPPPPAFASPPTSGATSLRPIPSHPSMPRTRSKSRSSDSNTLQLQRGKIRSTKSVRVVQNNTRTPHKPTTSNKPNAKLKPPMTPEPDPKHSLRRKPQAETFSPTTKTLPVDNALIQRIERHRMQDDPTLWTLPLSTGLIG